MLFTTTLNQMLVLVIFIAIGFILQKAKIVPDNSSTVVSKLENNLFIPALILNALMYTQNILNNAPIILFGIDTVAVNGTHVRVFSHTLYYKITYHHSNGNYTYTK